MSKIGNWVAVCLSALLMVGFVVLILCAPESSFELAKDSRLPKWIEIPPGLTRDDVSITMSYYNKPWGYNVTFTLQDKDKHVLKEVGGKMTCDGLSRLSQGGAISYPSDQPIGVNGETEIIEHKKMEPIFYVTDDPVVWKRYKAIGCER